MARARRFAPLSLSARFLAVAIAVVFGSMLLMGWWLSSTIQTRLLKSRAEMGAAYMQTFVAPIIWARDPSGALTKESIAELDRLLPGVQGSSGIAAIRIWDTDQTNLYSTSGLLTGKHVVSAEVAAALSGKIVSQIEYSPDDEGSVSTARVYPLFEIYTPIYGKNGRDVVAVGEFYEAAGVFVEEIRGAQRLTWIVVGMTSAIVILMLYVMVRRASLLITEQENQLKQRVASAHRLATQNMKLRRQAEQARIRASNTNEMFLNQIGSDIHDGPVQLISLLILKLNGYRSSPDLASTDAPKDSEGDNFDPGVLAGRALAELREISTGLVMPALDDGTLEDALHLAVERHQQITGTSVEERYEGLPQAVPLHVKICLFRVVQEGLNNAYRYADGRDQRVAAVTSGADIVVTVSDGGSDRKPTFDGRHIGLGLNGLKNRLDALGGELEIRESAQGGAKLVAKLSMRS